MTRAVIGFFNVFLIFIGLGCCLPGYGTKIGFSLHMEGICDDFMADRDVDLSRKSKSRVTMKSTVF
jgi:hypothetical protein